VSRRILRTEEPPIPVKLKCPSCGHTQQVPDEVLGKKVRCPACAAVFRVSAPKAIAVAAAAATGAQTEATIPEPAPDPTGYEVGPAIAPVVAKPAPEFVKPAVLSPRPAEKPKRGGLPAWAYAAMGGSGVMALIAAALLIRLPGGATSSRYPDPSVDVVVGIASASGQPAETVAAPTPPMANNVVASTTLGPVALDPPVSTPSTPAASDVPTPTAPASARPPAAVAASDAPRPASPAGATAKGAPKTTAEIVARCEPSVALVKGHASSGTGFVVRPGIVATNAHVIGEEFISNLEIQFPSAPASKQGPFPAELLFEDPKRDLAFLGVASDHSALDVAPTYSFVKGEDVMVIGNPGLGDEVVLENAISRGVISSKAVIEGMNYLQLSMAVNPGNSGGPVFDSTGRVIGVVTLKSMKAEALAFCIPVEDLQAALAKVGLARPDLASRHRAEVAFKLLTVAGALYGIGLDIRAGLLSKAPARGGKPNLLPNQPIQKLDELMTMLDQKLFSLVDDEIPDIKADNALAQATRAKYQDLSASFNSMKDLYGNTNRPVDKYVAAVQTLRGKYLRLVESLEKDLKMEVPANLIALLKARATDGQAQTMVTQIVPQRVQSRLRSRSSLSQRRAAGSRST
jgi:S1-C subfamily serine protease